MITLLPSRSPPDCVLLAWTAFPRFFSRSEEHTSELQSQSNLVCRLLLEKKNSYSNSAQRVNENVVARSQIGRQSRNCYSRRVSGGVIQVAGQHLLYCDGEVVVFLTAAS